MNTEAAASGPVWRPNQGPQTAFLSSSAREALYGGAAGGGKTDALVIGALRHIGHPNYNAIIFRRTFPELEGQVIPKSQEWYPHCGGRYNGVQHVWTFPSGSRIHFGHLQHDDDVHRYQGWEFQYIGFDELTTFTEYQYRYLLSRLRSAHGLPLRVRAGSNPGGEGHEWVFKRWGPWLDRKHAVRADDREVLHYRNADAGEEWCERCPKTMSRVFIGSRLRDNPYLAGTEYEQVLDGLDPLTRAQLRDGDWLARAARGVLFKRGWFDVVDAVPWDVRRVRCWDRAATDEPINVRVHGKKANSDPDYTVGVKLAKSAAGIWYVEDVQRFRAKPSEVKARILSTASQDGRGCDIALWQDPGQAGKFEVDTYVSELAGYPVSIWLQSKDKVTYAKPVSAQAEVRNIRLVRGAWNDEFLAEHEEFPEGGHDDQVDAMSGAFLHLTSGYIAPYDNFEPSGFGRRM